jgi:hypothetical protein
MAKCRWLDVEGEECLIVESLGYVHSSGVWAKEVRRPNGEARMAVKRRRGAGWTWWTPLDRAAPLIEALAREKGGA